MIGDVPLRAPIDGILRGLTHDGVPVAKKTKVIEVDPRADLARITGISQPHIHNVLKGKRLLSPEKADEVLRQLQIDLLDLPLQAGDDTPRATQHIAKAHGQKLGSPGGRATRHTMRRTWCRVSWHGCWRGKT